MEKKKKFIINIVDFLIWTVIIYVVFYASFTYLLPFIVGIVIAYYVQKPAKFISLKTGIKKEKCAAIISVVLFFAISIFLFLITWLLIVQLNDFIKFLSENSNDIKIFVKAIYDKFENTLKRMNLENSFKNFFDESIASFAAKVTSLLSNLIASVVKRIPGVVLSCIVTVVASCYISKDYDKLLLFVKGFVKKDFLERVVEIKNIATECVFKFLIGYFWLFLITFAELILGFMIFGIDSFLLLAFLVALLDLLPILGTGTVLIPWAVFEFLKYNYLLAVGLILLYLVISVARNVLEPKIIGKQMDINPLFTLVFIFIGYKIGGIIGMIALPILITIIFTYFRRRVLSND